MYDGSGHSEKPAVEIAFVQEPVRAETPKAEVEEGVVASTRADRLITSGNAKIHLRWWVIAFAFIAPAVVITAVRMSLHVNVVGSWCQENSGPIKFKIEQRGTLLVANGDWYKDAPVNVLGRTIFIDQGRFTLTMFGKLVVYGRNDSFAACSM
jgi:hypothetical protein